MSDSGIGRSRRGWRDWLAALAALALLPVAAGSFAAPPASAAPNSPHFVTVPGEDGAWSVEPAGSAGRWRVSWRAPERLPMTDDRPQVVLDPAAGGLVGRGRPGAAGAPAAVGTPTVSRDGRTVVATVTSARPPLPRELDVVLSGRTVDEPEPAGEAPQSSGWQPPERALLGVDPGAPGPLAVHTDDYQLPDLQIPGLRAPVEMVGHVVEPAVPDPTHPLVLLLHGRHIYCYQPSQDATWDWPCDPDSLPVPSQRGYHYLQKVLASQGYVTVSIAANGINAQDGELLDAGADARSRLVRAHLDYWAAETAAGRRQADLDRVVLVGHSRGGEGVARATLEIPLDAPYRIAGQVLLAPTDFSRQTTPYVPTVTVLPYCDGDVSDLQGQAYTDLSRGLVRGDTSMKSSTLVIGANHNFFNTQWTPGSASAPAEDDWAASGGPCGRRAATRLNAREQRAVGTAYVAGAARLFTSPDAQARAAVAPLFDGSLARVTSTGDAVVLSHALGGREVRAPGRGATRTEPVAVTTGLCRGSTSWESTDGECGHTAGDPIATPHWPAIRPHTVTAPALELAWDAAGGRGGLAMTRAWDVTEASSLDLRTVVDTGGGPARLAVRVGDADGRHVVAPVATLPALPRGPAWFVGKYWAQDLRVPTDRLAGLDLTRVVSVELVARSARGRVWLLDVSARPEAQPAVPARRAPLIDLGRARVDEGGPGEHVAEVPFTVSGTLTREARLRVFADDYSDHERRFEVTVPAGASSGVIRWTYRGNDLDSQRQSHTMVGHGVREVVVRQSFGALVIRDDDADVEVALRPVRARIDEGQRAVWVLRLSEPVDFDAAVSITAVRGPGAQARLRVSDVEPAWARRHTDVPRGQDPPLWKAYSGSFFTIPAGETSARVSVPIRDDDRVEAGETLSLRARFIERRWRSDPVTVTVRPGR